MLNKFTLHFLLLIFFLLLFLLLPTNNSVNDAYSYAGNIKHGVDLFRPHHLLYNITGFAIKSLLSFIHVKVNVLELMKVVNAVFAVLSLWVLSTILRLLKNDELKNIALIFFTGSSFAVMRFATENETYILPIFFSLCGSFYFIKFTLENNYSLLALSSFFGSIACLYHQIHFFWWFGIFISIIFILKKDRINSLTLYALIGLIVPLIYSLVVQFYLQQNLTWYTLLNFVFHDFYNGSVDSNFGLNNFILTFISFIRTFFQVHGNMFYIVKMSYWYLIPALITVVTFIYVVFIKREIFFIRKKKSGLTYTHLLIFVLQILFALYSVGNAEFMVMIPFLFAIIIGSEFIFIPTSSLVIVAFAMLLWNISYGLIPNYALKFSANEELRKVVQEKPESIFILSDKNQIGEEIFYLTGMTPTNLFSCPSALSTKPAKMLELNSVLSKAVKLKSEVYTDCIGNEGVFNRKKFLSGDVDKEFFKNYKTFVVDSFAVFTGRHYLYKVGF